MMRKRFKAMSMVLTLVMLTVLYMPFTASAAGEKTFDFPNGHSVTVSNVVSTKTIEDHGYGTTVYVVTAPVTVTFHGELSDETVIAQWFEDDPTGFNTIEIKDHSATLTEPTQYGVFPVFAGEKKDYSRAILLEVQAGKEGTPVQETPAVPQSPSLSAEPTSAQVLVNGKAVAFTAYSIDGNNYFKLRDLAMALNSFEVTWDESKNAIGLVSGKAYTPVGGELTVAEAAAATDVQASTSVVYVDGKETPFTAYTIGGNNYFKLRDVAKAINFGVGWNEAANTISIDTKASYQE